MIKLPLEIKNILSKLEKNQFEAYVVGGCLRDLLLKRKPQDWDIATQAQPQQIQEIFPQSFYKNKFGTVTIKTQSRDSSLKEVELTTYRLEQKYSDKRHPDKITFAQTIEQDLARRDFTINALAMDRKGKLIDLFNGQKDLKKKIIRTVGSAAERFNEDALRMLRAVRLASQLDFQLEPKTLAAIKEKASWLRVIAKERIRDELIKMIMSKKPDRGIELLKETGLLQYIIPELEKGVGISQNKHHIYTIYQHLLLSLRFAALRNYNLSVRLAALLHDIAKPQTKKGQGLEATFYNHDLLGARFAIRILERLIFPVKEIKKVAHLIRNHMFFYNVDEVSEAGVRRLLHRVGPENINDLINLRIADRLGSGCPKAIPYKLRHLKYLIEKNLRADEYVSLKNLKINGHQLMEALKLKPGPRLGLLLNALLAEAIENPQVNETEKLKKLAKKLNQLSDQDLKNKSQIIEKRKEEIDLEIKSKYWVK